MGESLEQRVAAAESGKTQNIVMGFGAGIEGAEVFYRLSSEDTHITDNGTDDTETDGSRGQDELDELATGNNVDVNIKKKGSVPASVHTNMDIEMKEDKEYLIKGPGLETFESAFKLASKTRPPRGFVKRIYDEVKATHDRKM